MVGLTGVRTGRHHDYNWKSRDSSALSNQISADGRVGPISMQGSAEGATVLRHLCHDEQVMRIRRFYLVTLFGLALAWAQFRESGATELAAYLELTTDPLAPARVYLFKDGRPFRLSPVQALLPLRVDLFYRERLWRSSDHPDVLEVTCNDQSHFFLLKGRASFDLPAGHYRVETYRGLFYTPVEVEFDLRAGETRHVSLKLESWAGAAREQWLSGDDHIHLTRSRQDDPVFLAWLKAEDLSVGNFLQLQRQMDAAVQYAFGAAGQATDTRYAVRPGHESRSEFYGHVNLLGGRELIRPLSVGTMYGNSRDTSWYPLRLFEVGRRVGALVGYAHFNGSTPHSTLLLDITRGLDFVEVFQFGVLKTSEWYELLNAGFHVTGIAGSDFPVPLNRTKAWPRWIPLLGPERTMVKAPPTPDPYTAWAAGVKAGNAIVTNGPLVELSKSGNTVTASAAFYRPLIRLEIVRNGTVIASAPGDERRTRLSVTAKLSEADTGWVAARVTAQKSGDEPDIQAHTNPIYLSGNNTVPVPEARRNLAARWRAELDWYRSGSLEFASEALRHKFFQDGEQALKVLSSSDR